MEGVSKNGMHFSNVLAGVDLGRGIKSQKNSSFQRQRHVLGVRGRPRCNLRGGPEPTVVEPGLAFQGRGLVFGICPLPTELFLPGQSYISTVCQQWFLGADVAGTKGF